MLKGFDLVVPYDNTKFNDQPAMRVYQGCFRISTSIFKHLGNPKKISINIDEEHGMFMLKPGHTPFDHTVTIQKSMCKVFSLPFLRMLKDTDPEFISSMNGFLVPNKKQVVFNLNGGSVEPKMVDEKNFTKFKSGTRFRAGAIGIRCYERSFNITLLAYESLGKPDFIKVYMNSQTNELVIVPAERLSHGAVKTHYGNSAVSITNLDLAQKILKQLKGDGNKRFGKFLKEENMVLFDLADAGNN